MRMTLSQSSQLNKNSGYLTFDANPSQTLRALACGSRNSERAAWRGASDALNPGEAIKIPLPLGAHHALGSYTEEPVVVIEVQMGSYFGEDDIVRVSDPYHR